MGRGCVPSLLFDLRPNHGGGNDDNGVSWKGPMRALLHSVPLTLRQPTSDPHPRWRLPDTHGHVWVSLLSQCSFLQGRGVHKVLFVPSKNVFPQCCGGSGGSLVGLMATSSKRAYAVPRPAASRAPAPAAGHRRAIPPQETLKHSSGSVSVGSLGPGAHEVCLSPLNISGGYDIWFKMWFCPFYL